MKNKIEENIEVGRIYMNGTINYESKVFVKFIPHINSKVSLFRSCINFNNKCIIIYKDYI